MSFCPRLTYAIAPPNQATPLERRRSIAAAQSALASSLPIDALLVYDVQDEAARNGQPRPFAFMPKVDPLTYALDELEVGALPLVVYHAVAQQGEQSLCRWLDRIAARHAAAVLVGAPSRRTSSRLTVPEALSLSRAHAPDVPIGGVVIPERHRGGGAEDARVWAKMQQGCSFFVSQTVWSRAATRQLLHDLRIRADREGTGVPTLVFTFSPCGSQQTLEFLEWLGVDVPSRVRADLLSASDMLARSIELAVETYAEVRAAATSLGFSVGCNVESVSSRAAEIEASVELVRLVDQLHRRSSSGRFLPLGSFGGKRSHTRIIEGSSAPANTRP